MRGMKSFLWQTQSYENIFRIDRSPELVFRWHHHSYWEIFGVVSGEGQALIGDYHQRVEPGEIYVTAPRVPHAFFALTNPEQEQASGDFFVFTIDLDALAQLMDKRRLQRWEKAARGGLRYRGEAAVETLEMLAVAEKERGLSQTISALQIVESLMTARRGKPLTGLVLPETLSQRDTERIERILKHLHHHFSEAILLPALAAANGMSEKTLSRIFKKSTGQTVVEYLNRLRVSIACQRLTGTEQPITQIAYDCGFGSLSSFNRMFSRYQKMTPSAYRAGILSTC